MANGAANCSKYKIASLGCEKFVLSTATNSPCLNANAISVLSASVFSNCDGKQASGKARFDVNVSFPPTDVPQSPLLIEYNALSKFISTLFAFRKSISASLDNFKSLIGVMISIVGHITEKITSKRTWSFPAPVLPCAMASAFISLAYPATDFA